MTPDPPAASWPSVPAEDLIERAGDLAALARAVDHDLAMPDHAKNTARAYAADWDDFSDFSGSTASSRSLPSRRPWRSI